MTATAKQTAKPRKERVTTGTPCIDELNLWMWQQVAKTDPAHVTKVNQRGGFNAIRAHWQLREATRLWGPIGIGFGWKGTRTREAIGDTYLIVFEMELWYLDPSSGRRSEASPEHGECIQNPGGRVDQEATMKATTHALSKALSRCGFSADVYMDQFSDQKYVAEMQQHFAEPKHTPATAAQTIKHIALVKPLRPFLQELDSDKYTTMTDQQIAEQFSTRASSDGVPFDQSFIDGQCKAAQQAITKRKVTK